MILYRDKNNKMYTAQQLRDIKHLKSIQSEEKLAGKKEQHLKPSANMKEGEQ